MGENDSTFDYSLSLFLPLFPTSLTHVALACMERPDLWKV